jgi:hypothetical protein
MWIGRLIGISNVGENGQVSTELPLGWEFGLTFRTAEIGRPVLTEVAILSEHEAREHNRRYRERAVESKRKRIEKDGPEAYLLHLDESALSGADRIDRLLDGIKRDGYFANWVIVEQCTYD